MGLTILVLVLIYKVKLDDLIDDMIDDVSYIKLNTYLDLDKDKNNDNN